MCRPGLRIAALVLATLAAGSVLATEPAPRRGEWRLSGSLAVEQRWFADSPAFAEQLVGGQGSVAFEPELRFRSDDRRHRVAILPFYRADGRDGERSHVDLREASYRYISDGWELVAGVDRAFWGVAESLHLVDTLNQVDAVEDVDGEDRLGQPMLGVAFQRAAGRFELFLLPGFRERTFAGPDGRLRAPLPVDDDRPLYESGAGDDRLDAALRWSQSVGAWDLGLHLFHGTGREPALVPASEGTSLLPFYSVTNQLGIDVQHTRGAWLLKLEGLWREGQGRTFAAAVGGFEYTRYGIGRSPFDLGLLVEYLWDGRDATAPPTAFERDLFVGTRLAFNDVQDSSILAGAIVDLDNGSTTALVEAERRLNDRLDLELEGRWFADVDPADPLAPFERDSFLTLRLSIGL